MNAASSTGERAFHVRPEAVDLVLSGLVQHVLVSLPANWVQAAGIRANVGDRWGPKRLWVGRLRHLRLLVRAEGLRQATVASHVRLRLSQKVQEAANGCAARGMGGSPATPIDEKDQKACLELTVRLVELDNSNLERVARAICALQRAFRQSKRSKLPKRKRQETPEEADAQAMHMLEAAFPGVPTKGFVIYLCGSTGIVGDSFRYLRMLAGMGFVVLAPDMLVSAAVRGSTLKSRQPKPCMLLDSANSEYWSKASLYADNSSCTGEMIYCSNADSFLSSPEEFNRMYSNIITLRQAELAHVLRSLPSIMRRQGVTLVGSSEGGVVLSCFQDEPFLDIINSRVILAYPCELNYWTYFRPEDFGIVGDPSIPTLNLVGCDDQYFGRTNSVASKVAEVSDLPAVHGHAFQTMVDKGIKHGLVCHFEGAAHTLLHTHDAVVREILADFLQRPHHTCLKLAVHWEKVPHLRSLIRRYRSHREPSCKVQYVRFCAPRSEQVVNESLETLKEEQAELMGRVDRVIYQNGRGKTSISKTSSDQGTSGATEGGAAPQITMERVASIITALHTSTDAPVHTCVSLVQELPEFVEKVEEQLEEILNHEGGILSPNSEPSPSIAPVSSNNPSEPNGAPQTEGGLGAEEPTNTAPPSSHEPTSNGASLAPDQTPSKPSNKSGASSSSDAAVTAGCGVRLIQRGVTNASTKGTAKTYPKVSEPQAELHEPAYSAARPEIKYPMNQPLATLTATAAWGEVTASALLKSAEVVAVAVGEHARSLRQAGLCIGGGALCLSLAIAMLRFEGSRNSS